MFLGGLVIAVGWFLGFPWVGWYSSFAGWFLLDGGWCRWWWFRVFFCV